jgi:hypothetical protein
MYRAFSSGGTSVGSRSDHRFLSHAADAIRADPDLGQLFDDFNDLTTGEGKPKVENRRNIAAILIFALGATCVAVIAALAISRPPPACHVAYIPTASAAYTAGRIPSPRRRGIPSCPVSTSAQQAISRQAPVSP